MAMDPQDDILQDFLVESREILEGLGQQLIDLERRPEDKELLNAVFRGFHTIKGGAGFLGLDELVDVCHQTEDIFNLLRQGEKTVTAELMDAVLQALDEVNGMFTRLENGDELEAAPATLLATLRSLNVSDAEAPPAAATSRPAEPSADEPAADEDDLSDQEFEALLQAVDSKKTAEAPPATDGEATSPASDEITDDEFESLLDDLHGAGRHGGKPTEEDKAASPDIAAADDEITDSEFQSLLDQLHGEGKGPSADKADSADDAEKADKAEPTAAGSVVELAPRAKPAPAADGGQARPTAARGETSVRVDTAKLDEIMNLVGELVLTRNRLVNLGGELEDERLGAAVSDLELVTSDLQSSVMKTRMQPIGKAFGRFPRVVRDLARSLKKEVQLTTRGEDTDLDKNLVEALADPLVHLVRNAVDHGMEGPEERVQAGKPRSGEVVLSAEQEGDHILLSISDDGRGMDAEALRQKAVAKGLIDPETAKRLDDTDCFNLIFLPGFSTKDQISDVSGRGVGMDVVKNSIAKLNGTVNIDSRLGEGTVIRITVPLTLAILPTLMVRVQGRKFALPMSVVQEIFELERRRTNRVDGRLTVMVRDKAMPLFFLKKWLERVDAMEDVPAEAIAEHQAPQVVTVLFGHQAIGFVVDDVIGLEEVVIKPLGAMLHGLPGLAGSTITGDGRIALIVDIPSLIKQYGPRL